MIERLSRQEILSLNKTFAAFIVEVQDAHYNPLLSFNTFEPGEMFVGDSETPRFVSQEECDRWNAEAVEEYSRRRDSIEPFPLDGRYVGERTYGLPRSSGIDDYVETLADTMVALNERLGWKAVVFLLSYSIPWLSQVNEHPPVKAALEFLRHIGVDSQFCGGFKASGAELKDLTRHLFWITRCNASLPGCYFSGIDTGFAADICKHGNIHFHFYSPKDKGEIEQLAPERKMIEIFNGRCFDDFPQDGALTGRQILV